MYYGTLADPKGDSDILQEIYYAKDAGFDFLEISAEGPKFPASKLMRRVAKKAISFCRSSMLRFPTRRMSFEARGESGPFLLRHQVHSDVDG